MLADADEAGQAVVVDKLVHEILVLLQRERSQCVTVTRETGSNQNSSRVILNRSGGRKQRQSKHAARLSDAVIF